MKYLLILLFVLPVFGKDKIYLNGNLGYFDQVYENSNRGVSWSLGADFRIKDNIYLANEYQHINKYQKIGYGLKYLYQYKNVDVASWIGGSINVLLITDNKTITTNGWTVSTGLIIGLSKAITMNIGMGYNYTNNIEGMILLSGFGLRL